MKARWEKTDLDALKASNPIEEVARDLGLTVVRHRMKCPMPGRHAHGDRTPSVTLSPERGLFKCWVCPDVKGDVIGLVQLIRGLGFTDALQWLQQRVGHRPVGSEPVSAAPRAMARSATLTPPRVEAASPAPDESALRRTILRKLLQVSAPISGPAARYLQTRRIFKRTWEGQGLRWIDAYARISQELMEAFGLAALQQAGFFNAEGHFRYYRHVLLFPYFDGEGQAVYLQARALGTDVVPKELSLSGPVPLPYNVAVLKQAQRHVYLCEGVIDTLTLIEQGFPALGVPGASHFKAEWAPLFSDHSVHIVFDPDAAGEAGAHRVEALLGEIGIAAYRRPLPAGKDINDWLRSGGRSGGLFSPS